MESLDDVIDAMIADRVIHRHRRFWLIAIAIVVAAILVVLLTGGWTERQGRGVPTLTDLPATVTAGRFEFTFTKAEIVRTPKGEYTDAEAKLRVYFEAKNIDTEKQTSTNVDGSLIRLVPADGKDLVKSNGADCRGELGWELVYGLPPESCFTEIDVEPDFAAETVEIGVLGERYEAASGVNGASDEEYWHNATAVAVVRLNPSVVIDNGENK